MKCCDLYGGLLRTRVQLQSKTRTPDASGGFDVDWATYATIKANVVVRPGREAVSADRLSSTQMIRAVIRFRADVNETDRAIIAGKAHQIRSVSNIDMRDKWMELDLEQGVAT